MTRADTYTGVVTRTAVERHLRAAPTNGVRVLPPRDPPARRLIDTLLDPWPSRCVRAGDTPRESGDARVYVPTWTIEDDRDLLMVATLALPVLAARRVVRVGDARTLQRAVMALGENALRHGAGGGAPPVAALGLEPQGNELQLVVTDLGSGVSDDALQGVVSASRRRLGSLEAIIRLAERTRLDLSLRLVSGTARAHWRQGRWRYDEGVAVPGWTAAVEIHL